MLTSFTSPGLNSLTAGQNQYYASTRKPAGLFPQRPMHRSLVVRAQQQDDQKKASFKLADLLKHEKAQKLIQSLGLEKSEKKTEDLIAENPQFDELINKAAENPTLQSLVSDLQEVAANLQKSDAFKRSKEKVDITSKQFKARLNEELKKNPGLAKELTGKVAQSAVEFTQNGVETHVDAWKIAADTLKKAANVKTTGDVANLAVDTVKNYTELGFKTSGKMLRTASNFFVKQEAPKKEDESQEG